MSDYTWEKPRGCCGGPAPILVADVADGVVAELYVDYQDSMRVSLEVRGDGVAGGRASTDKASEWPEVERFIPRAEWPKEIYAGKHGPAVRTPDEAVAEAVADAAADWADTLGEDE